MKSCYCHADLPDEVYATDTALEQDQSGLTMWSVLDRRCQLAAVITMTGAHTTVSTARTSPSDVSLSPLQLLLHYNRHPVSVSIALPVPSDALFAGDDVTW